MAMSRNALSGARDQHRGGKSMGGGYNSCRNPEDGRKDHQDGISFDRNRL